MENIAWSAPAIVLAINLLTSFIKKYVEPKWGSTGIHVLVFALAAVGAVYFNWGEQFPGLKTFVAQAGLFFTSAVAFYEVILSHLSFFKRKVD